MKTLLVEYSTGNSLDHLLAYGLKMSDLIKSVELANSRIAHSLKIDRDVLSINNGKVKASGVAGIVRLSPNIELEIMPKFFSNDNTVEWRTTLYLLSALSKHGNIMVNEKIKANTSYTDSLYDMAGRMLAEEYIEHKRKPIREYHKEKYENYCIDGELEFGSILERSTNGYQQTRVCFDKVNIYNATLKMAMQIVIPYVSDLRSKNILQTAIKELGNQMLVRGPKQKVPPRNKEWENAYNLSFDIVQGLGSTFMDGRFFAPGFIANTWQMWEWLITTSVIIGTENKKVVSQQCTKCGTKVCGEKAYSINVFPDVTVYDKKNCDTPEYLVDAKYKLIVNEKTGEIERSDIYEAYAFCKSLDTDTIFLAYPIQAGEGCTAGTVAEKSVYSMLGVNIIVVMVAFGAINERGGIYSFSKNFVNGIESILLKKM